MSRKLVSNKRLAVISAGLSMVGASVAFAAAGGNITISSSPVLPLNSTGLTQGLVGTVWHVPLSQGSGSGQYGIPTSFNNAPVYSDLTTVESYINSGSAYSSATATTYTLSPVSETFLNTATQFNYSGGSSPTTIFLGADAAGAAKYDGNPWYSSIVDQMGYVKIAAAGTYAFTMSSADDAGAVYIGGNGITPSGNAGTGTNVVALGYNSSSTIAPTSGIPSSYGTAQVTFSSAGYYPIEVMNYQQGGGAGFKFSITPPAGGSNPTYWTTTAMAASVTPAPATPVASPAPQPTDEWNFAKSTINGTSVSDIGTNGSAATAGTIVGTGVSVANGALVTTNTSSGNGMSAPTATFANYTGDFTISLTFNRSATDPTNQWGSTLGFGTKGAGGNSPYIIFQPQRQDGTNWSSATVNNAGQGMRLIAANGQPTPAGQLTQEVVVFNSSTNTASLYINGVLQMSGQPTLIAIKNSSGLVTGYQPFTLAGLADATNSQDGIGGLDAFGDPTTLASYYDLSTWNSALTGNQVAGLYASSAVPEPGTIALIGLGALGMLMLKRRKALA